jgi:hypothetical protein
MIEYNYRLWNGRMLSDQEVDLYNSLTRQIQRFEQEQRTVPEHLLNGRHNLIRA